MCVTPYADVNRILDTVQSRIRDVEGTNLLALYLTGSLVTGDFDHDVSDIDLVAVTGAPIDPGQLKELEAMHRELSIVEKQWDNRIEVAYLSTNALKTFRTQTSTIGITSPGEPFHTRAAGIDWLINWYVVRRFGLTLFGPPPAAFIDPISTQELVQAAQGRSIAWRHAEPPRSRNAQVYAILTMCRAFYTCRHSDYASKNQAAIWAAETTPEWSAFIYAALKSWREDWYNENVDRGATLAATTAFVRHVAELIERDKR